MLIHVGRVCPSENTTFGVCSSQDPTAFVAVARASSTRHLYGPRGASTMIPIHRRRERLISTVLLLRLRCRYRRHPASYLRDLSPRPIIQIRIDGLIIAPRSVSIGRGGLPMVPKMIVPGAFGSTKRNNSMVYSTTGLLPQDQRLYTLLETIKNGYSISFNWY